MEEVEFRLAVVDDEPILRENTRNIITTAFEMQGIPCALDTFEGATSFLSSFMSNDYTHIFLDIDMPGMNGLDLADKIRKSQRETMIIFVTSYPQYMSDAFGKNVLAYIDKAHIKIELTDFIHRIIHENKQKKARTITIDTIDGPVVLDSRDILFIDIENGRVTVHTKILDLKTKLRSIKEIEHCFDSESFQYCDKGILVNLHHIQKFDDYSLRLRNYTPAISVSRRRLKELKEKHLLLALKGDLL